MLSVLGSYLTNKIFTKVLGLGDGTVSKEPTTQGQGTEFTFHCSYEKAKHSDTHP